MRNRRVYPYFGQLTEWDAVGSFFGLNRTQLEWLFVPSKYPLGKRSSIPAVQARIRALIAAAAPTVGPRHEPEVAEAIGASPPASISNFHRRTTQ